MRDDVARLIQLAGLRIQDANEEIICIAEKVLKERKYMCDAVVLFRKVLAFEEGIIINEQTKSTVDV